ncbi:hypothetical protein ACWIUD_07225 [Helicobacter sp. 23-1044]
MQNRRISQIKSKKSQESRTKTQNLAHRLPRLASKSRNDGLFYFTPYPLRNGGGENAKPHAREGESLRYFGVFKVSI